MVKILFCFSYFETNVATTTINALLLTVYYCSLVWDFPVVQTVKNPPANAGDARDMVRSLSQEEVVHFLDEERATHSSILAWKIPCAEDPGRLESMGSQRVRHD